MKRRENSTINIRRLLEKGINSINLAINEGYIKESNFICIKEIVEKEDYVVIRFQGAFDTSTIPLVRKKYKKHEDRFDKHVIADFQNVGHIDCATLAILVNLFSELKSHQKQLVIVNATEELMVYTDILRLRPVLSIFPSEQEAITHLACK